MTPFRASLSTHDIGELNRRCRDAIWQSPFEGMVLSTFARPGGDTREQNLQPTSNAGIVYLPCEARLDHQEGVRIVVRLREDVRFGGASVAVWAGASWSRDEHSVPEDRLVRLGFLSEASPIVIDTVNPSAVGVHTAPGSHFYVLVFFDLTACPPPALAPTSTALRDIEDALREEREELRALNGVPLRDRAMRPLPLPHSRNLEFVYKVANLRLDRLVEVSSHDDELQPATACEFLQSVLVDRLHGPWPTALRRELAIRLEGLRNHSPARKRTRDGGPVAAPSAVGATSWQLLSVNEPAMYTDAEGKERTVQVRRVLNDYDGEGSTYYEITWERQSQRSKLCHSDGQALAKVEVVPILKGKTLIYKDLGCDVKVLRVLTGGEEVDDEGVPCIEIEFTRKTTRLRRST